MTILDFSLSEDSYLNSFEERRKTDFREGKI